MRRHGTIEIRDTTPVEVALAGEDPDRMAWCWKCHKLISTSVSSTTITYACEGCGAINYAMLTDGVCRTWGYSASTPLCVR